MAALPTTGLLDLEKELTCSICTEVLYQPLTLLDCLHTFCGSCLKDWFKHLASRANGPENPFTCPSCRASVRETRPDAKVTTLLDMFVQANPTKARTAEEKEEMQKRYKPGENVLPKRGNAVPVDEEDRRMLEEIREMSMRDLDSRGPRSYERGVRHRNRSRDGREEEQRQRRRREANAAGGTFTSPTDTRSQARRIGHQASLRSLLSSNDLDSAWIEEEILRQIEEEGLLDGVDLENLDASQADELSERIADAYRRRHHGRHSPRTRESQGESARGSRGQASRRTTDVPPSRRHHASSTGSADQHAHSAHPPVSRPHLLETYPTNPTHRRRTSSETRRQTSPTRSTPPTRSDAARSATDLSNRPRRPESRERRPVQALSHGRRATDPRTRQLGEGLQPTSQQTQTTAPIDDLPHTAPLRILHARANSGRTPPLQAAEFTSPTRIDQAPIITPSAQLDTPMATQNVSSRPSTSSSANATQPKLFAEPSIKCERCGKSNIEYELHENCAICNDGNYNICHRCYRLGQGCLHWFGFGQSAWHRFQQQASTMTTLPHTLVSHRYRRPRPENIQVPTTSERSRMSTEDPATRLESGVFCSICSAFADDCFWKCDYCNDGEWGYCNRCVNQSKCCTHPLLPVAHVSSNQGTEDTTGNNSQTEASFAPLSSPRAVQSFPSNLSSSGLYRPLTFSTKCDICKYPVQPSQTRFHCSECNGGDYDICSSCYPKLTFTGRISRENGEKGWRRCLRGHRMILVGFEDTPSGQRRIIVRDLVGGHALKDEGGATAGTNEHFSWRDGQEKQNRTVTRQVARTSDNSSASAFPPPFKFPPDGGIGMIVVAEWSWLPEEDATDELSFPRGAEIREVEDINGDWFWGCYAGSKGLVPAAHVRVLDVVTM
jgi:hypothetical protein